MHLFPSVARRVAAALVAVLLLTLSQTNPVPGQQPGQQPAPQPGAGARPATPEAIDLAIERGVRYLMQAQNPAGHWGAGTGAGGGKGWAAGYTALAGIALIECGVSPNDAALKRAAAVVRTLWPELDSTYEVALAILFLDRMGEKKDKPVIQFLAARLIAGQSASGGWGYKVPKLTGVEQRTLITALQKMNPPPPPPVPSFRDRPPGLGLCIKMADETRGAPPSAFDPTKARASAMNSLTPAMKQWPVFQPLARLDLADPKDRQSEPFAATTDNSNTHFATLAVWAVRKHDVPVEQSLQLLANRFRTSQGPDGTWGYAYVKNGGGGSPALTCVALLGLAIGHVVSPNAAIRPEQDQQVVNAFAWLGKRIAAPVGDTTNRPTPKDIGGLYYMWAMERVAVIYDVTKLDKKDWYLWGAEILLCHQKGEGNWTDGGYHGEHAVLNTSFALLFLKRANLTPDLSRRFTVDTTALTTKVDETVTPKPPVMMPETPLPPVTPPQPEPQPEPQPKPKDSTPTPPNPTPPTPTPPTANPQGSEPTATTSKPAEEGSTWPWILLIVALLGVLGACAFFAMKKAKANREAAEKPRKKKRKLKPKQEEDD